MRLLMEIHCLPVAQLTAEHVAAWDSLQRADRSYDSPYFRPEFAETVAAVRDGVEVAVLREHGEIVGLFPFQRRGSIAHPVGGKLSDFHGVVARGDDWDPVELLRACRLSAWRFDHLIASQRPLLPYQWQIAESPYIDLCGDQAFPHRGKGVSYLDRADRKIRYAEREAGPIRFELHTVESGVFRQMVKWKVDQYRRTSVTNVLQFEWTIALLEHIRRMEGEHFSGLLSALYFDGILAAVLLSMRSHKVLHGWFSAYRPEFSPLSPGVVLWTRLLAALPDVGIERVDLGKGPEKYKRQLMSGTTNVAEGAVDRRPLAGALCRGVKSAYDWARQSSLRKPLLTPGRALKRLLEARSYR